MMRINVLTDWGKAFVDQDGNFYCGTTEKQKDNAVRIIQDADEVVNLADVHARASAEFMANGGMYPAHNLVKKDWHNLEDIGVPPDKNVDPNLTDKLYDMVKDRKAGLIVPRHVFFQNYDGENRPDPVFRFEDVEETFGIGRLKPQEYMDGGIDYIVNAKHMFNGAAMQGYDFLGHVPGVPDIEMNYFTLLKQKYGQGKVLEFDFTGVVMGICVYQGASGVKQLFPKAKVNVIADAVTHLAVPELGIPDEKVGDDVARRMCQQVGINYMTTKEYLGR